MSNYKHRDMLKAVAGDLLADTIDYDHETGEPLNLDEIDEKWETIRDEIDEVYRKAKAFDAIYRAHEPLERRMSPVTVDEGLDFAEETEKIILKFYESGESE